MYETQLKGTGPLEMGNTRLLIQTFLPYIIKKSQREIVLVVTERIKCVYVRTSARQIAISAEPFGCWIKWTNVSKTYCTSRKRG